MWYKDASEVIIRVLFLFRYLYMSITKTKQNSGFTLIEILVVIGLIAILAAIVLIAINPARQFAQARNSQRVSNVETILNAVGQRMADNKGVWDTTDCDALPAPTISETDNVIDADDVDLSCLVPTYISTSLPADPGDSTAYYWESAGDYNTGYTVEQDTDGRITICAPEYSETAISDPPPEIYCLTR
jgi:type IV pilus assembly protein PilA